MLPHGAARHQPSYWLQMSRVRSILVVDDDPAILGYVATVLRGSGYEVHTAETPGEALASTAPVDILLTDVVMPGMNGPQLAERIRERHPRAAVLFMSGYDEGRLADCGAFRRGYRTILKPFAPAGLLETIEILIDEQSTAA